MISIKKLKEGDTVHIILHSGFPLQLMKFKTGYVWEIVNRPAGRKQSQATTTSFVGFVSNNSVESMTLYVQGNSGADSRLTKGTVKGSGPTVTAQATLPWNYIKVGWRLTRSAITTKDPIIPSRPSFGTNVIREKLKIP